MHKKLRKAAGSTCAVAFSLAMTAGFTAVPASAQALPGIPDLQKSDTPISDAIYAAGLAAPGVIEDHGEVNQANLSKSTKPECAPMMMVAIPGTFETDQNKDPNKPVGMLAEFAKPLRDAGGFSETYVNYVSDAGVNGTAYSKSVQGGVEKTIATLVDIQNRCENSLVTLTGFSQGAHIAGDVAVAVGNKQTEVRPEILSSVILWADPRRDPSTNIIAGTDRDLPTLPEDVQGAVDRMADDPSLAQVQLSAAQLQDGADALTNAFGIGSSDTSDDEEADGPSSSSSATSTTEKPSEEPEDTAEKDDEKDSDSAAGGAMLPSSNTGTQPQFITGQMGPHQIQFTHAANTTELTPSDEATPRDEPAPAANGDPLEEINNSPLGERLSEEDKNSLAESIKAYRDSQQDRLDGDNVRLIGPDGAVEDAGEDAADKLANGYVVADEFNQDREINALILYKSGLCGQSTLAGCANSLSGESGEDSFPLLRRLDNASVGKLTDMQAQGRTTLIGDASPEQLVQQCRYLRAGDCADVIDEEASPSAPPVDNAALVQASAMTPSTQFDTEAQPDESSEETDSEVADQTQEESTTATESEEDQPSSDTPTSKNSGDDEEESTSESASQPTSTLSDKEQEKLEISDAQAQANRENPRNNQQSSPTDTTPETDDSATSTEDTSAEETPTEDASGSDDGQDYVSDSSALADLWTSGGTSDDSDDATEIEDDSETSATDTEDSEPKESESAEEQPSDSSESTHEDSDDDSSAPDNAGESSRSASKGGEDVNIEPITIQGVVGGGLIGPREQDFGDLSSRVASICAPGDIFCSVPENSKLARDLVAIGKEFSINASDLDNAVARGDIEGMQRMGGLVAVQAVNQVAELSGLPPMKLSGDSINALIRLVAGASMLAAGDPTGAGVAMMGSVIPDLPRLIPELAEQIGAIPEIIEGLKTAPDEFAKNTGIKKLQSEFDRAFRDAGMGNVTDLRKLPEATGGLISDLLENNSGLLEMATNPDYYGQAHSFRGLANFTIAGDMNSVAWVRSWIDALMGIADKDRPASRDRDSQDVASDNDSPLAGLVG